MTRILVIHTSARRDGSQSRTYTEQLVDQLRSQHTNAQVTVRDLGSEPLPHLDEHLLGGWMKSAGEQSDSERTAAARATALVEELLASDILVIGSAMYNFGISSTLKAWLDHVLQAGRTFKYTENGPVGLAGGRKVYVVTARGGRYQDTPLDHQAPYLKTVFAFIGIDDLHFVHVEGQAMGEDEAAKGRSEAEQAIARVA